MRAIYRLVLTTVVLAAAIVPAFAVRDLTFEQLLSVVFFESEDAYKYPTPYLCRHITLTAPDDECKVSFRILDRPTCKVEIVREYRATYKDGAAAGREIMRSKDTVTIANINLFKIGQPVFDNQRRTARMTLVGDIDIDRHEGFEYSTLLDEHGAYRACRVGGEEKVISEEVCARFGTKPAESSRELALVFSKSNYNRSMAAVRWLQKTYCPMGGDPL